ncbi:four helix bundle protein [Cerasicoccus fimbriatus]|uniref:four helix bundle protein n=1 Tax=Cerasicoccus fimbriatus TaxID=3014554 RepID=UPI0022B4683C|nr:four helix bundle protein [Cerasicoccus sp. TK19100]
MQKSERDLSERTFQYARRVVRLFSALPKSTVAQVLGKQLLRSGTSVGANYREAERGRSKAEFISTMGICLRELNESEYWLQLLNAENIFPADKLEPIIAETKQLTAIFTTIIKKSKA